MIRKIQSSVQRHQLLAYFGLAYALSWFVCALLIARYNGLISIPGGLHYLVSFGPAVAALVVTALTRGSRGVREMLSRITKWRTEWLLVGLLSPLALAAIASGFSYLVSGKWPDLRALGQVPYLGDVGGAAALLLWIGTFGLGEEIGWRGFAFHRMEKQQGLLRSALFVGIFWALWHLPQFFYNPTFIALGLTGFLGLSTGLIAGSVMLSWLYSRSGCSILVVALWHALFNFTTSTEAAKGTIAAVTSTFVMLWAVAIAVAIWRHERKHLQATATSGYVTEGTKV